MIDENLVNDLIQKNVIKEDKSEMLYSNGKTKMAM